MILFQPDKHTFRTCNQVNLIMDIVVVLDVEHHVSFQTFNLQPFLQGMDRPARFASRVR